MGIEGYTPTPEELADAEGHLTPEQKIQSDAHVAGYNAAIAHDVLKNGAQEKTITHEQRIQNVATETESNSRAQLQPTMKTTLEKVNTPEKIKRRLVLNVGVPMLNRAVTFIKQSTREHNVTLKLNQTRGNQGIDLIIELEGQSKKVEKVVEELKAAVSIQQKQVQNLTKLMDPFIDPYKKYF